MSAEDTSEFCKRFNDIFDFSNNCRTRYTLHTLRQPFQQPLDQKNFEKMKQWADDQIHYIENLENDCGKPLIHFSRKWGFQGLVICLQNVFRLYEDLQKKYGLEYLLTHKMLQDMIENLFSVIRMMGWFWNNPTPYQFQAAIRRILIHHEVVYSSNSNCCLDEIKGLNISSSTRGSQAMEEDEISRFWSSLFSWERQKMRFFMDFTPRYPFLIERVDPISSTDIANYVQELSNNQALKQLENTAVEEGMVRFWIVELQQLREETVRILEKLTRYTTRLGNLKVLLENRVRVRIPRLRMILMRQLNYSIFKT